MGFPWFVLAVLGRLMPLQPAALCVWFVLAGFCPSFMVWFGGTSVRCGAFGGGVALAVVTSWGSGLVVDVVVGFFVLWV